MNIIIKKTKITKCPNCNNELEGCLVDATYKPFMCCGECGLVFDDYPNTIRFI